MLMLNIASKLGSNHTAFQKPNNVSPVSYQKQILKPTHISTKNKTQKLITEKEIMVMKIPGNIYQSPNSLVSKTTEKNKTNKTSSENRRLITNTRL